MNRSGHSCDYDEQFQNSGQFYRRAVELAAQGNRGQVFFRALVRALDAIPDKRLIDGDLVTPEGEFCAIGALGQARGVKLDNLDPNDATKIAETFGIATCLAREVMFENDEGGGYWLEETPEQRWQRMRDWAAAQIRA